VTSIRGFLTIVLLATMTLVFFVSALRGYRSGMAQTERLFDEQLLDIALLLENLPAGTSVELEQGAGDSLAFQIWRNGQMLRRSATTPATPIAPMTPGFQEGNFASERWRIFAHPASDGERWIFVAERMDTRFRLAEDIILQAVMPIILGLPIAGLLIWIIVGRGLKPLRQLAGELRARRADDLSTLPASGAPRELVAVIESTNSLLNRLSAAFGREKRFAADAAHELRTPISVLKVDAHNIARELPAGNENVQRISNDIDRLGHVVNQIISLYRTTPDQFMAHFTDLDLYALAQESLQAAYGDFSGRDQRIELTGVPVMIAADHFSLQTLMQNLLTNACKYTPPGGEIHVIVEPRGNKGAQLRVEDSGPGIAPAERQRVFERFYRVGSDRHDSGASGCGLGLAIVNHIVEIHNAQIKLGESTELGGLSVSIVFGNAGGQHVDA